MWCFTVRYSANNDKNGVVNDVNRKGRYKQTTRCIYDRFNFCHHNVVKRRKYIYAVINSIRL